MSEIIIPILSPNLATAKVTVPANPDAGGPVGKLLFDASTEESGMWQFKMPSDFSSGLQMILQYAMASATSGTVAFDGSIMAVADGENVDTETFDTVNSTGAITVPGTAGFLDTITTTLTNDDSVAADEFVAFLLARDVALDSATGDCELVSCTLKYTAA